jgi:hypothetical protein
VRPTREGTHHVLTSMIDDEEASTGINTGTGADVPDEVEHPHVLVLVAAHIVAGTPLPLVLRTFHDEVSHQAANGTDIPMKTVRGWRFDGAVLLAIDEQGMFAAHCTDARTGEPVAPERGVQYAAAWAAPSVCGWRARTTEAGDGDLVGARRSRRGRHTRGC